MRVVVSVDALAPKLTGIGRYAWELVQRLPGNPDIDSLKFYRAGRWVADLFRLLMPAPPAGAAGSKRGFRIKVPRDLRELGLRWGCRGRRFHGPNFLLPSCADTGVITVHDLSVFKFPETHPPERVKGVPLAVSSALAPRGVAELAPALQSFGLTAGAYGLCVSTLEPRKQIGLLLRAYRQLPASMRQRFPLVLIGSDGWLNQELLADIERARAEGWLSYLGFVPEAQLVMLYAGARAFFYPSSYEGFGLPPLEAMACGVPTVVSNASCLPEVTGGAALLAEPQDTESFARAIETALCDEAWRERGKIEGLKVSASYSWQRCVDQTVAVYRRAMGTA